IFRKVIFMSKQQIGVIGLAVMGKNLAMNIESRGYSVAVFNRTYAKTEEFLANEAKGKNFVGAETIEEFVHSLEKPRKIMLMVDRKSTRLNSSHVSISYAVF